jgi:hypothetical protein
MELLGLRGFFVQFDGRCLGLEELVQADEQRTYDEYHYTENDRITEHEMPS